MNIVGTDFSNLLLNVTFRCQRLLRDGCTRPLISSQWAVPGRGKRNHAGKCAPSILIIASSARRNLLHPIRCIPSVFPRCGLCPGGVVTAASGLPNVKRHRREKFDQAGTGRLNVVGGEGFSRHRRRFDTPDAWRRLGIGRCYFTVATVDVYEKVRQRPTDLNR